ncbi:aryl-alcohol dehydrogenase-like predicted oxidoreductase [Brachybacterium sacelli]|uniref:Aryl-alcohol dehydrogenase-like predicted oxidoreductase n=1 Tax=Brachybacterium sacelli TaxID=173364 RepID=A0ABS4WY98_9MICO|nr:aldo/keto reductase [Brachybacterium sacelli]MBP2380948.1 aryl-alcohol dehydrogenase-like predicted oxidoreductase [Brachybacterium sacelli]
MSIQHRTPSRLGRPLSVIGQGCWQIGADWGEVSDDSANAVLDAALDAGVNFFDTADVYGDGRSERLVGAMRERAGSLSAPLFLATKASRRADPFAPESFTEKNLRSWVERSRQNLASDTLDLVQLHCPPPAVYRDDRVFDVLDTLVDEQKIAAWGVSVETCEEALISLEREHLASLQIILNPFRLKPLEAVVPQACEKGVAVIARVPLASGLLTGKFSPQTTFAADDHRTFNRRGEAFDQGETFSGVEYGTGLEAVARLEHALRWEMPLPEASLRWILAQDGVTAAIPGASSGEQARRNAAAGSAPTDAQQEILARFDEAVRETYDELLRESIHSRW